MCSDEEIQYIDSEDYDIDADVRYNSGSSFRNQSQTEYDVRSERPSSSRSTHVENPAPRSTQRFDASHRMSSTAAQRLVAFTAGEASAAAMSPTRLQWPEMPKTRHHTFPGIPKDIMLPESALHVALRLAVPAGDGRNEETIIVHRTTRGAKEIQSRRANKIKSTGQNRDFSAYFTEKKQIYDRSRVDDIAYAEALKVREARRQKEFLAAELARQKKESKEFFRAGRPRGYDDDRRDEDSATRFARFINRNEEHARRTQEFRTLQALRLEYEALPEKKRCPKCLTTQSFNEYYKSIHRCQRAGCNYAPFQFDKKWCDVSAAFFARNKAYIESKKKNWEQLEKETRPPFRLTERHVVDPDRGEVLHEVVEPVYWEEVEDEFFERNEQAVDAYQRREATATETVQRMVESMQIKKYNTYRFSKPLPSFEERQANTNMLKHMSFEERLEYLRPELFESDYED